MALSAGEQLTNSGIPAEVANQIVTQCAAQAGNAPVLSALGVAEGLATEIASQATLAGSPPTNAAGRLVFLGMGPAAASAVVAYIAAVAA